MTTQRFSYRVYTLPVLVLTTIGLLASLYLAHSHYRNYTDIAYSSFCAISKSINCDTVSQSSWSILLGLPVAIWGLFAYTLFFILCLSALRNIQERKYLWDLLFVLSILYCITDVYFGYLAIVKIKAFCILCLLTYAVSMGLLFCTWIIRRRFNRHSLFRGIKESLVFLFKQKKLSFSLILLFLLFGSLKIFLPTYWIYEYPPLSSDIHTGTTTEGRPWIGAEQPSLVINEFADYQCFQCSKVHLILRYLVNKHPDTIRLVHYHYPMDEKFNTVLVKEPFHSGSGALALLGIAASRQNKFWQANDALYSVVNQGISEFNINKFAKKLQLDADKLKNDMYSQSALKKLEDDIRTGLKHEITGTPSFIVDDKVYVGHLPAEILKKISNE